MLLLSSSSRTLTPHTLLSPQARIPERIVEKAIVGMLPKNAHGRNLFRNLKVYKGPVRALH